MMPRMPFAPQWPEPLRAAMLRAILERGLSAPRALELAAAGQLEPGLAAGAPPLGTVRDWARLERMRRRAETVATAGPAAVLAGTVARLTAVLDRDIQRLSQSTKPADPKRVAEIARAGQEIAKLLRAIGPETPPAAAEPPGAPAGGFLAGLAADG
jgi:hypothetical protein